jgi:hypothetical protein
MNPDNPYAAPQTVEPRLDLSALPIADLQQPGGQRRRYQDRSTAELQRLFEQSQKLEVMFLVWLALWFATVAFLAALFLRASASSEEQKILGWIFIAMVTARLVCSIWRTKLGRRYMLLVDAVLICGCLLLICALSFRSVLPWKSLWVRGTLCLVLFTIAAVTFRSCQTLLKVRELFYPNCVQHDDLMRELAYRKEQSID